MGFVSRIAALALAATASVAAQEFDLDQFNTDLDNQLSQIDTNGTSCLLYTK